MRTISIPATYGQHYCCARHSKRFDTSGPCLSREMDVRATEPGREKAPHREGMTYACHWLLEVVVTAGIFSYPCCTRKQRGFLVGDSVCFVSEPETSPQDRAQDECRACLK